MDTNLFNLLLQAQAKDSATPWIPIVSAIITMIPAILAYMKGLKVEKDVKEVRVSVDGKLDQWLAVSKQQGKTEERQEATAAQAAPSQPLTEEKIRAIFAELIKK